MPDKSSVKIELNDMGVGSLKVDEVDVSNSTMRVQLDARPGRGTELVLHMRPGALTAEVDAGSVRVDPDTHMALVALGWSPPDWNVATTYFARTVLAATGSWDSALGFDAQCAAAEKAIEALKSRHRPAEVEQAESSAVVGEIGPVWMEWVLTWHPVAADHVEPFEVPLNEHITWAPEELGEFKLESREVAPPADEALEGDAR